MFALNMQTLGKKRDPNVIGSIYCITLDDTSKVFLQYIANDWTMMNSGVIRVFKRKYSANEIVDLEQVVRGEVWFYAHALLDAALRYGYWVKVGCSTELGDTVNIMFRLYSEGNTNHLTVSNKWYVWKINQDKLHVGVLPKECKSYDMGWIYDPYYIVEKIKTGKYPNHELN